MEPRTLDLNVISEKDYKRSRQAPLWKLRHRLKTPNVFSNNIPAVPQRLQESLGSSAA